MTLTRLPDDRPGRARFASCFPGGYHGCSMPQPLRRLCLALLVVFLIAGSRPARAADDPATFPLSDVKPGLKGVAYTIFEGDKVEKIDLEVIGVLHNAVGPKLDVILVRLLGDKVQQTGVVAGMSGSPVFFDGKLAGALALKLGTLYAGSDRRRHAHRRHARNRAGSGDRFRKRARIHRASLCPRNSPRAPLSAPDSFWCPSKRRW